MDVIACPSTFMSLSLTGTDAASLVDLGYKLSDHLNAS